MAHVVSDGCVSVHVDWQRLAGETSAVGMGAGESGKRTAAVAAVVDPAPTMLATMKLSELKRLVRVSEWSLEAELRGHLWLALCQRLKSWGGEADRQEYRDTVTQLEGEYVEASVCRHQTASFVPAFYTAAGGHGGYCLTDTGRATAARVLAVLQYCQPTITYCPASHAMCCLLLHYMSEENVYCCLNALLKCREQNYLIQTRREFEMAWLTLVSLSNKHVRSAVSFVGHFVAASENSAEVMADWLAWIFCFLPLAHVVRIVDCFLVEGEKILYRAAMAIMKLLYRSAAGQRHSRWNDLLDTRPLQDVLEIFCCQIPHSPAKLLKTMFQLKGFSRSTIRSSYSSIRAKIREEGGRLRFPERSCYSKQLASTHHAPSSGGVPTPSAQCRLSDESSTISIKELSTKFPHLKMSPSELLSVEHLLLLWEHLPQRFALYTPTLLYTSNEHGFSLKTFYSRVDRHEPTVLLLRTSLGAVLGAYCTASWCTRNQLQEDGSRFTYFGTGEMFVFTLRPEFHIYPWVIKQRQLTQPHVTSVAHAEQLFMAADNTMITVGGGGGGQAIWLDENLSRGKSDTCATFDNPPLVAGGSFSVACMEALGFSSP